MGADAVFLFADPRHVVGPLRAASGDSTFQLRIRAGLRGDGAGAYAWMAVSRADTFGDLLVQHAYGHGVHQRRDAAGEACKGVWYFWCGVRDRLRSRASDWRMAWRDGRAAAILGGCRIEFGKRYVRTVRSARITGAGKATDAAAMEESEPHGSLETSALASRAIRVGGCEFFGVSGARNLRDCVGAL